MPAKRTQTIVIRLSPGEHAVLSQKASDAGITISALVRDHIGQVRVKNDITKARWLQTLIAINNSLSVLVERAISFEPVDAAILIAYASAIRRRLAELSKGD